MDRPRKKRKTNIGKAVTAQSRSTFVRDTNNFCPVTRLTRTLAQRLLESNSVKWCFLTNYSIVSLQVLRGSAASVTVFLL